MKKSIKTMLIITLVIVAVLVIYSMFYSINIPFISESFPENYSLSDVKISMSWGGGYSLLKTEKTVISGDGSVNYVRLYIKSNESVFMQGKIDDNQLRNILNTFKSNNFFLLKSNYNRYYATDKGTTEVSLTIGNKTKVISEYGNQGPRELKNIQATLYNLIQVLNETTNSSVCEYIGEKCYGDFYTKLAIEKQKPEECESIMKISRFFTEYEKERLADNCYFDYVLETKNISVCSELRGAAHDKVSCEKAFEK